ncbi:MAG TPA: NfeD family protein [Ottowia sp.]|uniref:NfeD family protein n=1 Tax=Ottowia sp. TaxID=1898956 RepID=UPI002CF10441|nr:NfeD family protein [Ottowia sp.]HMN20699.1 NfeD family protein [Ottowia sp.]
MADSTIWWVITGVLVALELASGTFYLLMLAIGSAAGAVVAHSSLGPTGQMAIAAVVGGVAVFACYLVRRRRPGDPSPRADRSVNLDVGEIVRVEEWDVNGAAQIRYRGASWTAVYRGSGTPQPGRFRVAELQGNRLVLESA